MFRAATFDLDILIEATEPNVERLLQAHREAGFGTADLIDAKGVLENEITIFNDRVRIDVQTSTPGLTFEGAWDRCETMDLSWAEVLCCLTSRRDCIEAGGRSSERPWKTFAYWSLSLTKAANLRTARDRVPRRVSGVR